MELKNKLSFGAVRMDHLMEEYFDRSRTLGFCKACPNYEQYWSCPPYQFDEAIFLKQFKYMHIIGRQYEVPRNDIRNIRDPKAITDYCNEKMEAIKVMTWKTLLEIENEVEGVIGLIPGNCPVCKVQGMKCARETNQPCRFPKLMRFSLESLGFDVVSLVKYEVGMMTKWPENQRLPETLTSVSGILCNEEIPKEILKKYFPDKKKPWERSRTTQDPTAFHVSEMIKPSETVHGTQEATKRFNNIIDEEIPPYRPQKSWVGYKAEREEGDPPMKTGWTVTIQGEDPVEVKPEIEEKVDETSEEIIAEEEMTKEITQEEITEAVAPVEILSEDVAVTGEEDDLKYKWLGFKGKIDDFEDLPKRPIPKMTEMLLDGEEPEKTEEPEQSENEPVEETVEITAETEVPVLPEMVESEKAEPLREEVVEEPVKIVKKEAVPKEIKVVKKTTPSLEKTISDLVKAAASGEEMKTQSETKTVVEEPAEEAAAEEDDLKYKWLGYKGKLDDEEEKIVTKSSLSSLVIPE